MAGKAAKDLLKEEREAVLSRALEAAPVPVREMEERNGEDPRRIVETLLDYIIALEEGDETSACRILTDMAGEFSGRGMAWRSAGGLWQALASSICEHLDGKSDRTEMGRIGSGLLHAQAEVFETCMAAEARRRDRIARHLREVDRFPDTIAATLDPLTLTRVGMDRLKGLVHVEHATIMHVDASRRLIPTEGDLVAEAGSMPALELKGQAAFTLLELGDPYWEGPGDATSCLHALREIAGEGAVLLLPMTVRGRTTGVIFLCDGRERKHFTRDEIELASRFASRFAVALENASLHAREQRKIKETVALLEITRAINSTLDLRDILARVVQMTVDLCGVVMCAVFLRGDEEDIFLPAASYGFLEDSGWEAGEEAGFIVTSMDQTGLETLHRGEPVAFTPSQAECMFPADLLYEHGVDLVFVFPLSSKEMLTGVLVLFYPCRESEDLDREEVEVVRAIAAQASMAIENAALYEDIEKSYFSTVQALAKAIEVKDPYTHGHSERVTEYALMIADAMCLEERDRQKLKYAATLHDIGKIGIAGRVLNKPGSLTDEEYTHVKTHPMLGVSIIEPVEFLQGPRPIILHHHEHYDGNGYPTGLKGDGIPLCARILSVADAFEAMRSDRPYRRALPLHKAKDELLRNAGTQFDPEVVETLLDILERYGDDPIKR
jgi:HD-GYP domain-containing protein (c-di-GMP phosphodiesterase class II)